jgi:aminobenzoyl-glutamate transport protein
MCYSFRWQELFSWLLAGIRFLEWLRLLQGFQAGLVPILPWVQSIHFWAGLSEEAAHILDPSYRVNPTANYYFMVVSTFVISIAGTWVTERIVAPRLGEYTPHADLEQEDVHPLSAQEKKGLRWAMIIFAVFIGLLIWGNYPSQWYFACRKWLSFTFACVKRNCYSVVCCGCFIGNCLWSYHQKYKNDSDVMDSMADSMKTMGTYIVLVFFAAQFVAYF